MDINSLRPAKDFAVNYGVKAVIYGEPGTGKTPLINTAPRPLLLVCEPGLLSMRHSTVATYPGFTAKAIDEFFAWWFNSHERKSFDTLAVDSLSQMCEIYLEEGLRTNKHGLAAYGEMNRRVLAHLEKLYFTQYTHTYLISKQETYIEIGVPKKRPYYPGKELPIKVPHRFDQILHLGLHNVPGVGQIKAFRCRESLEIMARDRTGNLADFEPPDFGQLVAKAMK